MEMVAGREQDQQQQEEEQSTRGRPPMQRCRSRFDNNKLTAAWLGPWPVDGRVPRTIRIVDQLTSRGTEYGKSVANQTCLLGTWNTDIERVAHSYLTNTRANVLTTPSALVPHCIGSESAGDGPQTFNGGKTRGRELVAARGFDRVREWAKWAKWVCNTEHLCY